MDGQQERQQHLNDIANLTSLALVAIQGVSRTVQVWSRMPGSCGRWFFGWVYGVGVAIQVAYYQLCVLASGRWDQVPLMVSLGLGLVWLSVHGLTGLLAQGQGKHSYEPGQAFLPGVPSVVADVSVACAYSGVFWILASPIQASWYAYMIVWILVGYAWIHLRDFRRQQAWFDSQYESERWSQQIRRK